MNRWITFISLQFNFNLCHGICSGDRILLYPGFQCLLIDPCFTSTGSLILYWLPACPPGSTLPFEATVPKVIKPNAYRVRVVSWKGRLAGWAESERTGGQSSRAFCRGCSWSLPWGSAAVLRDLQIRTSGLLHKSLISKLKQEILLKHYLDQIKHVCGLIPAVNLRPLMHSFRVNETSKRK